MMSRGNKYSFMGLLVGPDWAVGAGRALSARVSTGRKRSKQECGWGRGVAAPSSAERELQRDTTMRANQ